MKTREEFKQAHVKLCVEYIRKMHNLIIECREQGVSTEEYMARLDVLKAEFDDKYQRLALNTYKHSDLKL